VRIFFYRCDQRRWLSYRQPIAQSERIFVHQQRLTPLAFKLGWVNTMI
jgi:hypothetical protein